MKHKDRADLSSVDLGELQRARCKYLDSNRKPIKQSDLFDHDKLTIEIVKSKSKERKSLVQEFNKFEPCPKCSSRELSVDFYAGTHTDFPKIISESGEHFAGGHRISRCTIKNEHLHLTCRNCKYEYIEKSHDARVKLEQGE